MFTFADRRGWTAWTRLVLRADLSAAGKTVLLALSTYAHYGNGTGAFPGEELLATDTGLDVRTVRRALTAGRAQALIEQTARANPKGGTAAVYRLTFPRPLDNVSSGHHSPVNSASTGHLSPVETDHHRTAVSFQPDSGVPPPRPYTNTNSGVFRDLGTEPSARSTTTTPPSPFCDAHPQGTRRPCGACANARVSAAAWQAGHAQAAAADAQYRRERRAACPWCEGRGVREVDDDTVERCDHEPPGLSLVPRLENVSVQ